MLIDSNAIDIELEKLIAEQIPWFNSSKLDAIAQVKNVTAVIVRTYAPNVIPPQTWWLWVDIIAGKSYISVWTALVSDRSILGTLWWSLVSKEIAVWNISGNVTSFSTFGFDNATWIFTAPIANITTEYRVWWTRVVTSRQTSAYTADAESGAYTGIDNAQAWTPYAQLTDINQLRVAYEALRAWFENLRTACVAHWLISP